MVTLPLSLSVPLTVALPVTSVSPPPTVAVPESVKAPPVTLPESLRLASAAIDSPPPLVLKVPLTVLASYSRTASGLPGGSLNRERDSGLAFDGLVWCDDHWAWFPKPYRFLANTAETAH